MIVLLAFVIGATVLFGGYHLIKFVLEHDTVFDVFAYASLGFIGILSSFIIGFFILVVIGVYA